LRNTRDQGKPIKVDPTQPIVIDKSGVVSQGGQEIAQIEISGIDDPSKVLGKLGTSYFAFVNNTSGLAGTSKDTEVSQGTVEQSNVPVADAAVRLVDVMRQFEMLQKAITVGADMNRQAIEQVAKVS
jgi:flagellar basal body rod protein FlgG